MESTRETYKGILEDVLKRVTGVHKEFCRQRFCLDYSDDGYTFNVGIGKKAWTSAWPKWPSGFWLCNLWLENLTSEDEEHPSAAVYIAPEKSTLHLDDASNAILNEAKRLLPTHQVDRTKKKNDTWVEWPLPTPRRELLKLLGNEDAKGFIETLAEHFETLMHFIPVMDEIFQAGKRNHR
jgi:hypothetical protein